MQVSGIFKQIIQTLSYKSLIQGGGGKKGEDEGESKGGPHLCRISYVGVYDKVSQNIEKFRKPF